MSRCDYEGVFYRVFCVSLLVIAFTFTVILTNVFIDIDNLLNKRERGSVDNLGVTDQITDNYDATTETQDYYIGVERDETNYRSKRSLDSNPVLLRISNPKTKRYLTNRLAALLEALDDDEPENKTPKTDTGNIYIKTVKQKNNIEINEREPIKADEDINLALHNMLQGTIGYVDVPDLLNKLQSLVNSVKKGASERESKNAGSAEEFTGTATESKNLSEEPNPMGVLKYKIGKRSDAALDFNDDTVSNNANKMRKKKIRGKNKNPTSLIRTVINIEKDDAPNSRENFEGIIKLIYNGKPINIRGDDSHKSTTYEATTIATTTVSENPKTTTTTTNTINKDVADFAGVIRDKFHDRYMPNAYLKTIMLQYLKNLASSNRSSTTTTIVEKNKIRIKRNLDWSNEKQSDYPQTKDDDELFVEIETHFDKTGLKGEKKRKLVTNLIKKIQNAIRSSPEDKELEQPIMKRVQNPLGHGPEHKMKPVSQSYRDMDPISKSMPLVEPLPLTSDKNGENWKKLYQEPKFLSSSKSINSAELNLLAVDYHQDTKYPAIPKRQQIPLTVDTSGENINTVDVGKLQLLIKDIEGSGFSIGYNQYVDEAPDPESIKLFHGIEHIVDKYHQKHDKPDQPADHEGEYEIYGQALQKREVKSETSLRTKRFAVQRNNDFISTLSKPSVIRAYRNRRSLNLKRIINSNKKIQVSKYINTNAFSRQRRYFKKVIRNKRQIDNIKVIDKRGQAFEDNNMFVVSDGDTYNDNLMVRHRQKDHFLNQKPFFQPSNKPFSPHKFEIKNENKNVPMFFENTGKDSVKMQEKKERNKRHTIKIYARDMEHRDTNERSFTEYDEDNENAYADRTLLTQLDGPQIFTSDDEERQVEFRHSRLNSIPVIYKNPFMMESNDHVTLENKNPVIFNHDQHEFSLDPVRDQIRRNPLMSKYPHVFVEERTSGERPEQKHIHRSIYSMPENTDFDKSSDTDITDGLYQAPNVQDLVNAIVPSNSNNYKISVKLIPHNDDNDTKQNFKEVHTSINKTFNKDGLLYSSLVNVSEISKVQNYTSLCNHHLKSTTPPNIYDSMKSVQLPRGYENIFMASKLADSTSNILTSKQKLGEATTEATMQMNLMDIILPSSPRRVFHLTVADVGKLICDSMKSQMTNMTTKPQIVQTRKSATQIKTTTTATTTAGTTTTAIPTEVATTIVQQEKRPRNTQTVDPLKIKLLKAMSLNEQLTGQILDRIDQNTDVLQTFLSKIATEIAKLPDIADQAIKKDLRSKKKPGQAYLDSSQATINVTEIAPSVYSIQQTPQNLKPAVLNQNFIQSPLMNNQRVTGRDVQKLIPINNTDELKRMDQMKYFIDYDPKSSVPQNIPHEPDRRVDLDGLDEGINKLKADHLSNINLSLNNIHRMMPAMNNAIVQNNGTHYLR